MPAQFRPAQAKPIGFFFFTYYGYVGLFSSFVSLYFAQHGMSAQQIGVLMALMQVTRIFGPNMWGALADHSQRRVGVMQVSAIAALVSFIGMFWAHTFIAFFILMFLINFFTSAHGPLSAAVLVTETNGDVRWYGRLRLWGSVGFICSVLGAGKLLDMWGVAYLPALSCVLLASMVIASFCMRESKEPTGQQVAVSAFSLFKQPEVTAFFVSVGLMVMAHSALYVFYSLYLEKLGYGKTFIGAMWSLGVLAEIAVFYFQAPLFRYFGLRQLMLASLLIAVARFAMIGWGGDILWLIVIAQVLHAATFGIHHSASVIQAQRWFSGPLQGRGQALLISIPYGVGGTVGGIVMGVCWDEGGAQAVYFAAALICALAYVCALMSYHWIKKSDALKRRSPHTDAIAEK